MNGAQPQPDPVMGPYQMASDEDGDWNIWRGDGSMTTDNHVAQFYSDAAEARARLFCAAPDLLLGVERLKKRVAELDEVMRDVLALVEYGPGAENCDCNRCRATVMLRAAIAKAEESHQ